MVKGVSRQVIVVQGADQKLFDQAIFILKDSALGKGVTDEALLKEAERAIHSREEGKPVRGWYRCGPVWAAGGAVVTGLIWLITAII